MSYFIPSNVSSTSPIGRLPSWFEAVNSEFYYEQTQIQDMKAQSRQTIYANYVQMPEQTSTAIEHIENYQRPISAKFASNANYLALTEFDNSVAIESHAPCQGPRPWNFAQCYGFYGQPACPLGNIIDMEDFM